MTSPAASESSIMRRAAAKASSASPAPSARPTMTWPAMAIASSTRARKPKSWKAIWWAATVAAPMRAHTAVASTKQPSSAAVRTKSCAPIDTSERMRARSGRREHAQQHGRERDPHPELRQHRAPGRAVEAPIEAVDEEQLEHDVDDIGRHDDDERRAQVAHAAQPALAGQRHERHRHPERGDAQVARRQVRDVALAAQRVDERLGQRRHDGGQRDPGREREPERLRARARRRPRRWPAPCRRVTRAVVP